MSKTQIDANRIVLYSQCPNKFQYLIENKKDIPAEEAIIQRAIKHLYSCAGRSTYEIPSWKRLRYFITHDIEKAILSPDRKLTNNNSILSKLLRWYNDTYLMGYCDQGIINFPVELMLNSNIYFTDSIDIISIGEVIRLFDFTTSSDNYTGIDIQNDLEAMIKLWTFIHMTNITPNEYIRIVVKPNTIATIKLSVYDNLLNKIERILYYLIYGIGHNIYYPIFSQQCKYCTVKEHCII